MGTTFALAAHFRASVDEFVLQLMLLPSQGDSPICSLSLAYSFSEKITMHQAQVVAPVPR